MVNGEIKLPNQVENHIGQEQSRMKKTVQWDKSFQNSIEKSIRDILQIIKTPDKVYGHGVVSHKQLEKVEQRLSGIEDDLRSIKNKLRMLDRM